MINIVCALTAEAQPVVDRYKLRPAGDNLPFSLFLGERVRVLVTGVGKPASAAGVGYLFAHSTACRHDGWLNLGVAGHGQRPVGTTCLVTRFLDRASHRSWYPPQIYQWEMPRLELITVDSPETDFPDDRLFDMEGSAFAAACIRWATGELVQSIKVVSDNRETVHRRLGKREVSQLIATSLDDVDSIVTQMLELSDSEHAIHSDPPELAEFLMRWHFTATRQRQLRDLLRRWHALEILASPLSESSACQFPREVLRALSDRLDHTSLRIGPR